MRGLSDLIGFFKTGDDRERAALSPSQLRTLYERKRWSVFLSVTLGYGLFYTCRTNLSMVKKPLLDEGLLSPTEMGLINSLFLVVYAIGRFTNGTLADHANIRRYMSAALALSAFCNLWFGFQSGFFAFAALWFANGWFQSIGSAPSVVALSQWFAQSERGTRYGIWSTSHSIGKGITYTATAFLIGALGWRYGFFGPGLLCVFGALALSRGLADRPETYGLPPVHEYKGEPPPSRVLDAPTRALQWEVLKHPGLWVLAGAGACMSAARYGMDDWVPLFFQVHKGYSLGVTGPIMTPEPIAEALGALASGFLSDRWFRSKRMVPALLFASGEIAALILILAIPPGHPFLHGAAMTLFGFSLGGLLVFLGGLMAVDLVPQRAAGTAMGFVGLANYIGAGLVTFLTGVLLDQGKRPPAGATLDHALPLQEALPLHEAAPLYDFTPAFTLWISAVAAAMALTALSGLFHRPGESPRTP